ncbi:MAG: hypothetical protein GX808_13195 [Syntrophomonadaceae bacterium]|jgi:hypothetical protein|nr:hypothetical protein [Syntrophomonadaceae bacterium]
MRSAIWEISILIAFFIGGWLIAGWNSFFYIAVGLIVFYNLIMIIYMVSKRSEISRLDMLLVVIAMVVWLAIAWAMIMEKQYNFWGLLQ